MSTAKEIIKAAKELFTAKKEKIKLGTITEIMKWDTTVDQDTYEVGTLLTITYDDGTVSSIGSGEYELENGDKIQVNADGVIVLVTPKSEKTPAVTDQVSADETKMKDVNQETEIQKVDLTVEEEIVALKEEVAALKSNLVELSQKVAELSGEDTTEAKPVSEDTLMSDETEENKEVLKLKAELAEKDAEIQKLAATPAAKHTSLEFNDIPYEQMSNLQKFMFDRTRNRK